MKISCASCFISNTPVYSQWLIWMFRESKFVKKSLQTVIAANHGRSNNLVSIIFVSLELVKTKRQFSTLHYCDWIRSHLKLYALLLKLPRWQRSAKPGLQAKFGQWRIFELPAWPCQQQQISANFLFPSDLLNHSESLNSDSILL